MDAIVYTSNSGYTAQYAGLLGEKTGLPVFSLEDAKPGSKIIYLGWLMAGKIKGLKKAEKLYDISAVVSVGMSDSKAQLEQVRKSNSLQNTQVFLVQGGFDITKLHGIYKFMMNGMKKTVGKSLAKKQNRTAEEDDMLDLLQNGGNRVSIEKLAPVLEWYAQNS